MVALFGLICDDFAITFCISCLEIKNNSELCVIIAFNFK